MATLVKHGYDPRFACASTIVVNNQTVLPLYYYHKQHEDLAKKLHNPNFTWTSKYLSQVPYLKQLSTAEYIQAHAAINPPFDAALQEALDAKYDDDDEDVPPQPYYYKALYTCKKVMKRWLPRKSYKKHVLMETVKEGLSFV